MPVERDRAATPPVATPKRRAEKRRRDRPDGGMWPHTNRVLPWIVAAFLVMLFLVPFDSLVAPFSIGVDSKLDRVVLVGIIVVWIIVAAAGGRNAPRFRRSPLNVTILCFVVI